MFSERDCLKTERFVSRRLFFRNDVFYITNGDRVLNGGRTKTTFVADASRVKTCVRCPSKQNENSGGLIATGRSNVYNIN